MAVGKGVTFDMMARNRTAGAMRGVIGGLRSVRREMYTGQPLMKSWNAGLNSNRRAVQQLGFQVGDFATQIAGGQSAMLAFTQQGGQMLQFFGPMGAVMAALLAVFGSLTIAIQRSGGSLVALAPALMLTSDQIRMIADAWHWLGQSLLTVANLIVNHLGMIMGAAVAVAVFFAGKWVASMIAAAAASNTFRAMLLSVAIAYQTEGAAAAVATFATNVFTGALIALRAVLMTLGIGLLLVAIGWLTEAFMRVAKSTGGFAGALRALADVAGAVFDYLIAGLSPVTARFEWAWNKILAGFASMLETLRKMWASFMGTIADSIANVPGMGDVSAALSTHAFDMATSASVAAGEAARYNSAAEKALANTKDTTAAAGKLSDAWNKVATAWRDGASAIDLGSMFGGAGAGGGGGGGGGKSAVDKAKEAADEIQKIFDDMQKTISDSIMSSFKSLLKGTTSLKDALLSVLGSILDKIMDIVATPVFNAVAGSITSGIIGSLGMKSYEGGGYTWPGPRSGGVDGKGGRLAVLHSDETVTDHRAGGSVGGTVINMTINTPDAASFQASRRQIMQQMQSAVK